MVSDNPEAMILDKEGSYGRLVKSELESIILALLLEKPMCGTDIIKTVHAKFGLLLSPGTIYPLLHDLERRGLVRCDQGNKVKVYRPVKEMRKKIGQMLRSRVSTMKSIIDFLMSVSDRADSA
ncbi:MAG: PadR family transcriptional regulator [Hadesarchaea archaeon]|nr:PadR family transcriptional regulator [Hadesarchaea archaeon]